eukprot:1158964-Pelagomonas_calceolata.AAC.1
MEQCSKGGRSRGCRLLCTRAKVLVRSWLRPEHFTVSMGGSCATLQRRLQVNRKEAVSRADVQKPSAPRSHQASWMAAGIGAGSSRELAGISGLPGRNCIFREPYSLIFVEGHSACAALGHSAATKPTMS